jgi:hypothetical protein
MLSHHKLGRHSVASQAVTSGESVKAVKAQLGHKSEQSTHKYAHLKGQRQMLMATWRQRAIRPSGSRPQNDKSKKAPISQDLFSSCAGVIRSMYHEVWAGIRVPLAA